MSAYIIIPIYRYIIWLIEEWQQLSSFGKDNANMEQYHFSGLETTF